MTTRCRANVYRLFSGFIASFEAIPTHPLSFLTASGTVFPAVADRSLTGRMGNPARGAIQSDIPSSRSVCGTGTTLPASIPPIPGPLPYAPRSSATPRATSLAQCAGVLLSLLVAGGCGAPARAVEPTGVPPAFRAAVQTGDLVLRRGRSLASQAVILSDGRGVYSHAGVAIRRGDSVWVVHVAPRSGGERGFVVREPLEAYLHAERASAAGVFRPDALRESRRDALAAVLDGYARRRLPFDGEYDLATPERLYCTELIWRAFRDVGIELLPWGVPLRATPLGTRRVVFPSDLARAPRMRRVATFEAPRLRGERLVHSFLSSSRTPS